MILRVMVIFFLDGFGVEEHRGFVQGRKWLCHGLNATPKLFVARSALPALFESFFSFVTSLAGSSTAPPA